MGLDRRCILIVCDGRDANAEIGICKGRTCVALYVIPLTASDGLAQWTVSEAERV